MLPKDYNEEDYIHFIRKGKELLEIPFNEVKSIDINKNGANILYTGNNVINVERYLLRYWCPVIKSDAIMLFLHLWEYCDKKKGVDICFPKINELSEKMGKSKPTITKLIDVLEENNFLIRIHRLSKLANNRETTSIYKLRQTVPLISKYQYSKLSKGIRDMHDEYIENFGSSGDMNLFQFDHEDAKELLYKVSDKIISKSSRKKIDSIIENEEAVSYLIEKVGSEKFWANDTIKDNLQNILSKPSFETFYSGVTFICNEDNKIDMIFPDEIRYDFYMEHNFQEQQDRLDKAVAISVGTEDFSIRKYKMKNYIVKILKSE